MSKTTVEAIIALVVIIGGAWLLLTIMEKRAKKQRKGETAEAYQARMQSFKPELKEAHTTSSLTSGWSTAGGIFITIGALLVIYALLMYGTGLSTRTSGMDALAGVLAGGDLVKDGLLVMILGGIFCGVRQIHMIGMRMDKRDDASRAESADAEK